MPGIVGRRTAPRLMEVAHSHTDVELNYVVGGSITYFAGGRRQPVPAGRASVFWAGLPHRVVAIEGDPHLVYVVVPLGWFLQLGVRPAFVRRLLAGDVVQAGARDRVSAATDGDFFARWADELSSDDAEIRRTVIVEIEARLRRFAATAAATAPRRQTSASAHQLERIAAFAAANYRGALSAADIGRALGMHPNYVMTLFKRGLGLSLWEYVLRLRVSHAQRLLLTTDLPVERVAAEAGFGSAASFYRTFRRVAGSTPRAYRLG